MALESWEWSDDAKALLYFVYRFWAEQRRPPNQADICLGTSFDRRQARRLCRQLREGFAVTFAEERVNLAIDKAAPFSATPTAVACFRDGEFLTYVGCPMEVTTIGWLPMLEDHILTMRSHCSCCFEPIELELRKGELLSATPVVPVVAAIRSPWDFEYGVPSDRVCDSFHYALDETHARRFEERVLRRGVVFTFEQVQAIARSAGEGRMRDPHWKAIRQDGERTLEAFAAMGIDVTPWR
jgi:hypothetical protein